MLILLGIVELVEIASIAHDDGQHVPSGVCPSVGSSDYALTSSCAAALSMTAVNTIYDAVHPSMLILLGIVELVEIASIAHNSKHRAVYLNDFLSMNS